MANNVSFITLTTDFGLEDTYAAEMKGVLYSINPDARIIDITHRISPQNVIEAAVKLACAYHRFPAGTIHVAVVDPGVGGERRGLLLDCNNHLFVGPDNGIFTEVMKTGRVTAITNLTNKEYFRNYVSPTFHGRDIFSPVAAHLSRGIASFQFGNEVTDPVTAPIPEATLKDGVISGEVLYTDSYGNLITNIRESDLENFDQSEPIAVATKGEVVGNILKRYSEGSPGKPLALIGSTTRLEIAVPMGSAVKTLGVGPGAMVMAKGASR